ncbi:3-oxo-5-alpha-steroid 4-dehydrogenase [Macleaya cordata]|uniref:3-oxo-5-alpha-steroid 4-dehydrogenase n=1 Tax=Macleaya cordata TaxID=56857 RepID=A0A200PYK7_MACCD|nr:3-oxo-5-alpha-steroid 4-dehydrogenase [Macleaya cordata]
MMSLFDKFLFPPPPSLFMTAMSVISFTSLTNAGFSEIKGTHVQYSKFWNGNNNSQKANEKHIKKQISLPSRTGMLILYTPACLAGAISFWLFPNHDLRFMLVNSALTLHFFKRVFEVLFVHRYSGGMLLDSTIMISLSYFISTVSMIYNQHLIQGTSDPQIDLKLVGIVVFLVGIVGNFYHHYILSKLREKNDKEYKIPTGGLFGLVICPHYLFEILVFVGVSLISQTVYPISFTIGTAFYLTGRSYATRNWYLSKFPSFPKHNGENMEDIQIP